MRQIEPQDDSEFTPPPSMLLLAMALIPAPPETTLGNSFGWAPSLAKVLDDERDVAKAAGESGRELSQDCRGLLFFRGSDVPELTVPKHLAEPDGDPNLRSGNLSSAFENYAAV